MASEPSQEKFTELEDENRRLRRAVEELSILNAIGTAVSSTMSLKAIVELIVQESVRQLKVEQGAVMLLQEEKDADPFRTMARKAHSTDSDVVPFRFGQQLTGWMLKHQKPLLINDLQKDPRFKAVASSDFHSLLSVPLRAKGQMVGLLNVFNKQSKEGFGKEDQKLLSIIASQSAQIARATNCKSRKRNIERSCKRRARPSCSPILIRGESSRSTSRPKSSPPFPATPFEGARWPR